MLPAVLVTFIAVLCTPGAQERPKPARLDAGAVLVRYSEGLDVIGACADVSARGTRARRQAFDVAHHGPKKVGPTKPALVYTLFTKTRPEAVWLAARPWWRRARAWGTRAERQCEGNGDGVQMRLWASRHPNISTDTGAGSTLSAQR